MLLVGMSQVDTKPTEEWGDIGGLDKQIQELMEVRAFRPCCSSHAIPVSPLALSQKEGPPEADVAGCA